MGLHSTVNKTTALQTVVRRLQKMEVGESLILLTWKKDRSVRLRALDNNQIEVVERGFKEQRFNLRQEKLRKQLKILLKREFSRSHKIRLKMEP